MAEETPQEEKKSLPIKQLITMVGLLVVEAALIIGVMMFIGAEPEVATAETPLDPAIAEAEKIVEVLVLDGKLPNAKSGVAFLYSTEVYVQVRQRHSDTVRQKIDQFYNEIKADITAIWRTSEPHHFQEPKLETLTRKVYAMLNERFGLDVDSGEPVLVKCVVVMGTGFRVDR